jgi:hypothetical protein
MRKLVSRKINMNTRWLMFVLMMVTSTLTANALYTEKQLVAYAKALDVSKLDPTLSSQRLDEWLRSGPVHVEITTWTMSDCDLKPSGSPNYVAPLCVKVRFTRGNVGGRAVITIGTFQNGISGTPHFENILVASKGKLDFHYSEKLSDLPRLLDDASASTGGR